MKQNVNLYSFEGEKIEKMKIRKAIEKNQDRIQKN